MYNRFQPVQYINRNTILTSKKVLQQYNTSSIYVYTIVNTSSNSDIYNSVNNLITNVFNDKIDCTIYNVSHSNMSVVTLPKNDSQNILPGSVSVIYNNTTSLDNNYKLYKSGSTIQTGIILYQYGVILLYNTITSNSINIQYINNYKLTQTNVGINVKKNLFNYTTNMTAYDKSTLLLKSDKIVPYITTIGLYNEDDQLLAIAKLCQPIKRIFEIDTHFQINFTQT